MCRAPVRCVGRRSGPYSSWARHFEEIEMNDIRPNTVSGHALRASVVAAILCASALPVAAAPLLASVMPSASQFTFVPKIQYRTVQVRSIGPNGFHVTSTFQAGQNAYVQLPSRDGLYKYELSFSPLIDPQTQASLLAARQQGVEPARSPAPRMPRSSPARSASPTAACCRMPSNRRARAAARRRSCRRRRPALPPRPRASRHSIR